MGNAKNSRAVIGLLIIMILLPWSHIKAQEDRQQSARQKVAEALSGKSRSGRIKKDQLEADAWEALSYLREKDNLSPENLEEAVPDYYRFHKGMVELRLVDPKRSGEYQREIILQYELNNEGKITLRDTKTGRIIDNWRVLYLDDNYLALDMGDLRVFFNHTRVQQ